MSQKAAVGKKCRKTSRQRRFAYNSLYKTNDPSGWDPFGGSEEEDFCFEKKFSWQPEFRMEPFWLNKFGRPLCNKHPCTFFIKFGKVVKKKC